MSWDGRSYDVAADPQAAVGIDLIDRLVVAPGGSVVDAGCGSGRVTEALLDARPDVAVLALDASASMLDAARPRLARFGSRVVLRQVDLARPWSLESPVDAVLSSSTFHWVLDHDRLFGEVFRALRPGGCLVARCGGEGSLATVRSAAAELGVAVDGRNTYAGAEDTRTALTGAGFVDVWAWLEAEPVSFPSREELGRYLADAALAPYERGTELAPSVAERLVDPVADFVRLNLLARRPDSTA